MASDMASTTALIRKRADAELMPPPPPTKRIKRPKEVLDEDTYTDALSHIIARDFFPGLLQSETQQEYLDALESKDQAWIASAARRLQQIMTPGRQPMKIPAARTGSQTPTGYAGDTPMSTITAASAPTTSTSAFKSAVDMNLSLGAFQAKYTSEDNESFYKLLDKQNLKRAEKYGWLWRGNKLPSKMQLKQKEIELKLSQSRSLIDDGFKKGRLAIKDKDDRPAAPDHWKAKPNNELMFIPDGVDGILESVAGRAQAESRAPPKTIVYENTRAPVIGPAPENGDSTVPPSPSLSAVRDAIAGRHRPEYQESSVGTGGETPRVNGYAFVDDEEPAAEAGPAPVISLTVGDVTPNPFKLQEQRKREALHYRMVERIHKNNKSLSLAAKAEKTPVPRFPSSPRVSGALTPAAQRLWGQIDSAGRKVADSPFAQPKSTPVRSTPLRPKGSRLKSVIK
ncbi:hypothetical protein VTK73DRAFT_8833 [Phialemonium thermophilum]|uniref:Nuclear protein Es2 n=1 Tax=Phialemonium thermophilum TaxID=223376 RepID=A0ABR3XM76_9PEZI